MLTFLSGMTYRRKTSDLYQTRNYTHLIAIIAFLTPKGPLASLHHALRLHPRHSPLAAEILK